MEPSPFTKGIQKDLLWIGLALLANFLLITIPSSETGKGIRYGGFALILMAKYIAVYWAAARIPFGRKRVQVLHIAALLAFLWVVATMLADRFHLIEIDTFTDHLPKATAGYWSARVPLCSTVSPRHGGTTVVILILGALVVGTAQHRFARLIEVLVFALGTAGCFISGSRQGLVRMITFVVVYAVRRPLRYLMLMLLLALLILVAREAIDWTLWGDNPSFLWALERQEILLSDPFSSEGMSGRPELWRRVVDILNEEPIRWVIGYGLGNYVEYRAASHNMVLRLIQDGGFIELLLVGFLWIRVFRRVWGARREAWPVVALTTALLTSVYTSAIFYPTLATGWYLGLFFVALHVMEQSSLHSTL